jgi:hypothetical protein
MLLSSHHDKPMTQNSTTATRLESLTTAANRDSDHGFYAFSPDT